MTLGALAGATSDPGLDLFRCTAYPPEIHQLIEKQAFDSKRRDVEHWARMGPSMDSWRGWIWSYGNDWFWTEGRGAFELIPRMGRGSARPSTAQSRSGYSA